MRRERITHTGAYHHVMNRGYDSNDIFAGNKNKSHFLDYLEDFAKKMHIRLFAYCIKKTEIVDTEYVNQLFGDLQQLFEGYDSDSEGTIVLAVRRTKHGEVLGSNAFMKGRANCIIEEKFLLNKVLAFNANMIGILNL